MELQSRSSRPPDLGLEQIVTAWGRVEPALLFCIFVCKKFLNAKFPNLFIFAERRDAEQHLQERCLRYLRVLYRAVVVSGHRLLGRRGAGRPADRLLMRPVSRSGHLMHQITMDSNRA